MLSLQKTHFPHHKQAFPKSVITWIENFPNSSKPRNKLSTKDRENHIYNCLNVPLGQGTTAGCVQACHTRGLTRLGESRDWKWRRRPALAICSNHLLLASSVSISYSLLLSNIWFKATISCSEKAQTVATRLWQKTMSRLSCISLSVMGESQSKKSKNGAQG